MEWLRQLHDTHPVAHAMLALCLCAAAGSALGSARIRGIKLGTAGVLFAGLGLGRVIGPIDHVLLDFLKDAGLVLFVFMIGLQMGPGFFASLRREGMRLNALAVSIVLLGTLIAYGSHLIIGLTAPATVGTLAGAVTNTPSLGAAQQTFAASADAAADAAYRTAVSYAVAYPIGIAGIILSLLVLKWIFGVDPAREARGLAEAQAPEPLERRTILIENPSLSGLTIAGLPHISDFGVRISRHRPQGQPITTARGSTVLHTGDLLLVVGVGSELDHFERMVGRRSDEDLMEAASDVRFERVIVTKKRAVGEKLADLHLGKRFGVQVTRLTRGGVELPPAPMMRLYFGDVLRLVGDEAALRKASAALGNSPKALNETHFMPIFLGIAAGIVLGLVPIAIAGIPAPVRLGLAGGPLILAILLSRAGNIGPLVWYIPPNANMALRELGITLFLACVGLKAAEGFFGSVGTTTGLLWAATAVVVTIVPLIGAGLIGRYAMKLDYATLAGLLAGSMTDPPALAFATGMCKSEAPSIAYAAVYPMTMLMRIAAAQLLVLVMLPS